MGRWGKTVRWAVIVRVAMRGVPALPPLGPPANNGGLTLTRLPLAGSPLVDGGDTVCPTPRGSMGPLIIDRRGVTRPQGPNCDAEAYEWSRSPSPSRYGATTQSSVGGGMNLCG